MSWRQKPESVRQAAKPRKASEILRPLVIAPGQFSLESPAPLTDHDTVEDIRPAVAAPRVQMKPRPLPLRERMGYGAAVVKSVRPAHALRPATARPPAELAAPLVATPELPAPIVRARIPTAGEVAIPVSAEAEPSAPMLAPADLAPTLPPYALTATSSAVPASERLERPDLAMDGEHPSVIEPVTTVDAPIAD